MGVSFGELDSHYLAMEKNVLGKSWATGLTHLLGNNPVSALQQEFRHQAGNYRFTNIGINAGDTDYFVINHDDFLFDATT